MSMSNPVGKICSLKIYNTMLKKRQQVQVYLIIKGWSLSSFMCLQYLSFELILQRWNAGFVNRES